MNTTPINTFRGFPDDEEKYKNKTLEQQQLYWNNLFFQRRRKVFKTFPIDIINFKKERELLEPDFNRFLPGIIDALMGICFEYIEDMFILDDATKSYLYEHAPELLKRHGGADIQEFVNDTKNNIKNSLKNNE